MLEIMTFEEIELHYDGQWVLIAHTETDKDFKVAKGKAIAHSATQLNSVGLLSPLPNEHLRC